MLLEFKAENYKSFKDEVTFSMIPAAKQKGLDYSILHKSVKNKKYKALSVAVVYGANASGKTNIIGAMQTFKSIVLRGNILNTLDSSMNYADNVLELIPNNALTEKKPVCFSIKFIHKDLLIFYSFKLDLGSFLDKEYNRSVKEEILAVNDKVVFERSNNDFVSLNLDIVKDFALKGYQEKKYQDISKEIARNNIDDKELFLSNGFKNIFCPEVYFIIKDYFSSFFKTFYHAELMNTVPMFDDELLMDEKLNLVAREFGINSNELLYVKSEKSNIPILCSNIKGKKPIPADIFESYGTLRFINIYPLILGALKSGGVIVIDEFDASIHPMAIINLINIFHNDEINVNKAQLIFNTHNPLYLNGNILRRDEIKFVERDDETKCSKHYSLSDFGTKGTNARKGKDYMNKYFVSEYGAIKDIDFTNVFKKILGLDNEEDNK